MYWRFLLVVSGQHANRLTIYGKLENHTFDNTFYCIVYLFISSLSDYYYKNIYFKKSSFYFRTGFHPYFINCVVWLSVYRFLRMSVIDSKLYVRCTVTKIKHFKKLQPFTSAPRHLIEVNAIN